MRLLLLSLLFAATLPAQTLSFFYNSSGATPGTPLPSTYQFPDTPQDSSSSITLKVVNNSSSPVYLGQIFVTETSASRPNFSVGGLFQNLTLAPQASTTLTLYFIPLSVGQISGTLQASYSIQQNGCSFTSSDPTEQCPGQVSTISTLSGTGTPPQLVLSYSASSGSVTLQPNSSTPLNFGNVSTSATSSITFTLANEISAAINTPTVALQNQVYASSAFKLDTSSLPATIAANSSATFTLTFAPGQIGVSTTTLVVGTNSYAIEGSGVVVADIDALAIYYVDQTGVRTLPQAATPIDFGQLTAGVNASSTLTFTVTNPSSSFNSVTISTLAVSGAGFTLSGGPSIPTSIAPGQSITFQLAFSGATAGKYNGTLSIGSRQFSLAGQTVASPLPSFSFNLSQQPLTSQQQVNLTVQFASASTVPAVGELSMQFTPSVSSVTDDPAVVFLATNGRQLQLSVASGATTATYQGQSALTFQTGTTAGTITFTLTFTDTAPFTQTFTIAPAQIQITSATAVRQSPNLVVTLNGYDNTYSAGQLSFTFYDTSGKVITPNGIQVDASSSFHQYFFTDNQAGGAFALQASFPVTGDVTQVGSVAVALSNSAGQTSTTQTFQ